MSLNSSTSIFVDGHSLAFRSYYAFDKSRNGGLKTSTGIPTSVCFGFFKSLLDVMASQKPEYLAIAFDLAEPTFRHEADENYKSNRSETPADLLVDVENLKELLNACNIPVITAPGYEADDILGTLAAKAKKAGARVKILSGDRDLFQLIDEEKKISVLHLSPGKGSTPTEFFTEEVIEKLGVTPEQIVDYKALCGDKSDCIPGIRGIGEKTAVKLLKEFDSLEGIYQGIDNIKGANRKKLEAGKADAEHSQFLAKIEQNVPLEIDLEDCKLEGFPLKKIEPILRKLELQSFIDQITKIQKQFGGTGEVGVAEETEDEDLWFFSAEDTAAAKQQTTVGIKAQIIDTPAKLKKLIKLLKKHKNPDKPVAWDTETTALEPRDAELVGIGCCWGTNEEDVAYIPTGHNIGKNLDKELVLGELREILESTDYPKVFQNAKFDRSIFRCQGITLRGVVFDTMLASYVLEPEGIHNLGNLAYKYLPDLGITSPSYKDLVPKNKTIADLDIAKVAYYCGSQVYATFHLVDKLGKVLAQKDEGQPEEKSLRRLLMEVELPLEPVLAEMEYVGIRIDSDYLQTLSEELGTQLEDIENKAYEEAGEKFNLASPKQLSELLFEKLNLSKKKSRKTKTGYSTNAAVLEKLQGDHPVIDSVLEHRTLAKLKSTYVDALPQLVREDSERIHTDFNQTVTATGRLSSSSPNLQNIPIRTEFSRQIRKAFLPEEGWLLASADYSQIELRILAHLSQEPVLMEAYQNNSDVHTVTAQLLFDKEKITPEERRMGKTINFGVIYGMGALKFGRSVGLSGAESKEFLERYKEQYSKVFDCLDGLKREAIARGYVQTILGRRRYFQFQGDSLQQLKGKNTEDIDLDDLNRLNFNDAQSLRAAANAPIQGSSADIIKKAMVKMHEVLSNYQARMLLQVHDELVFEVPPEEWEELQPLIKSAMENAVELTVPLVVDIHAGENWMEAK
ncbi:MAG: DNA polymerase I [Cyanobacteriota bacterium]|nr:DNA polymerase I [Cyanobacteriota bacterium]